MRRGQFFGKSRSYRYLAIAIVALVGFVYSFFFLPPTYLLSIFSIPFSIVIAIFLSLFLFLFSIATFLFHNKKHGLLLGSFVILYLFLRVNGFTHPLFLFLLIALFLSTELMLSSSRTPTDVKKEV